MHRFVLGLAGGVVVAACGTAQHAATGGPAATGGVAGGGNADGGTTQRAGLAVAERATVDVEGAVHVQGTYGMNVSRVAACSTLAKTGVNGAFDLPTPSGRVAGHALLVSVAAAPYHGAGSYGAASLATPARIVVDGDGYVVHAPSSVTIHPDGSGVATMVAGDSESRTVRATVTWSCVPPGGGIVAPSPSAT